MSKEAFSIFDILREQGVLKEAEGDENTSDGASTTDNNNEADNGEDNETGKELMTAISSQLGNQKVYNVIVSKIQI